MTELIGSWDWHLNTDINYPDRDLTDMYSIDAKHQYGCSNQIFEGRLHSDDSDRVIAHINQTIHETGSFSITFRVDRREGGYKWIYGRGHCIGERPGAYVRFAGINIQFSDAGALATSLSDDVMFHDFITASTTAYAAAGRSEECERLLRISQIRDRLDRLTDRERQVLLSLTMGQTNKEVGRSLGISPRTVEIHKHNIAAKLAAGTLQEAIALSLPLLREQSGSRRD